MHSTISPEIVKTEKKKKLLPVVLIVSVGVVLVGVVVLLLSGVIYVGAKLPSQRVVVQTSVCSSETTINKLHGYLSDITNSGQESTIKKKTKEAIGYITSQSSYNSDPTCAEALTYFYHIDRDSKNLSLQIGKLKELAEQGRYPSNKFDSLTSITSKEISFESLPEGLGK